MGNFNNRRMYHAVCDQCGAGCELPFQPTAGKPVYCSDCFRGKKSQGGDRHDNGGRFERRQEKRQAPDSSKKLDELNAKLDKIISILEQIPKEEPILKELEKDAMIEELTGADLPPKKSTTKKKASVKKDAKKSPSKKVAVKKTVKKVVAKKATKKSKK